VYRITVSSREGRGEKTPPEDIYAFRFLLTDMWKIARKQGNFGPVGVGGFLRGRGGFEARLKYL